MSIIDQIQLNWGIKRSYNKSKIQIQKHIVFPLLIKYVYKPFNKIGLFSNLSKLIQNVKKGYVDVSPVGYSKKATRSWIELENKVSSYSMSLEANLLTKQINILKSLIPKKICVVDLGTGKGDKGLKFILTLQENGFVIEKYIAFDGQPALANSAVNLVNNTAEVPTRAVVDDLLSADNLDTVNLGCKNTLFMLLGNTIEVDVNPNEMYKVLKNIVDKHKCVLLGIRYSRSSKIHRKEDIDKLTSFYELPNMLYPFSDFFSTIPRGLHRYIKINHKWDDNKSCLKRGVTISLPSTIASRLSIKNSHWVQLGRPVYFRTLNKNLNDLRKYVKIASYKRVYNPKDIWDQMALLILTKK